jgi:hypothetical protein
MADAVEAARALDGGKAVAEEGMTVELACQLRAGATRTDVHTLLTAADVLEAMPVTRGLFDRGVLSWGHVRALASGARGLPADARRDLDRHGTSTSDRPPCPRPPRLRRRPRPRPHRGPPVAGRQALRPRGPGRHPPGRPLPRRWLPLPRVPGTRCLGRGPPRPRTFPRRRPPPGRARVAVPPPPPDRAPARLAPAAPRRWRLPPHPPWPQLDHLPAPAPPAAAPRRRGRPGGHRRPCWPTAGPA